MAATGRSSRSPGSWTASLFGQLKVTTGATNNHENWMQYGAGGNCVVISSSGADSQKLWFECRVSVGQITTTSNFFCGQAEEASGAADFVTDAGALKDCDWLGFWALEAASQTLAFGYKIAGQTKQDIIASLHTFTVDGWVKLGFTFDPNAPTAKRIKIFKNGVEQTTYVTGTQIAAATFPLDQKMSPIFGCKNNNAAVYNAIDWWACSQESA